jgi:hypothetical protein
MGKEFTVKQEFDSNKMRHYLNGELTVMHCHHYATLFTQLADDAKLLKGPALLAEAAEESMHPVLVKYFKDNNIDSVYDRAGICEQYYCFIGLGEVKLDITGDTGSAEMAHSHVDEGWLKKWDKRKDPINFMGKGFLAAAFSAINNAPTGTYTVEETQSIVCGADSSKFTIKKK